MEKITIMLNNRKRKQVAKGTTLLELSLKVEHELKYAPLVALVDGHLRELSTSLNNNCKVQFLDLTNFLANKVYGRGLCFVLSYAIKELYGNKVSMRVRNSFDKGTFIELSNIVVTDDVVKAITRKMQEVVVSNIFFRSVNVERLDAMKHYKLENRLDKYNLLRFNTNTFIKLYRLNNTYDFFFGMMPPSTGVLQTFAVTRISDKGILLRYPTPFSPDKIPPYNFQTKMFEEIEKVYEHGKKMNMLNASDLNRYISEQDINDLIRISEAYQNDELFDTCKLIAEKAKIKIILISGPSSSGKTTTSKKLANFLAVFGIKTHYIGLDDYFHDRDKVLGESNCKSQFESIKAVDTELFNKQVKELFAGKKVNIPKYNFVTGLREYKNHVLNIEANDVLIVEGLHALNDELIKDIPRSQLYKIYLSPLTQLNIDDHNALSLTDIRLMRRIIRDRHTRGYRVVDTIKNWHNVRAGEEKYVFPYQNKGDIVLNTSLIYEMCVLRTYVEAYLYDITEDMPEYEEAKRLLNVLKNFLPIPSDAIPADSILREFIGGSCYE